MSSHTTSLPAGGPPRLCQNCSAPLTGPYCAQCGQHDVDYHRSFHHLTHDLLENLFHFEGKFFASVAWLLARPGRLTNDFIAGRRISQLNPLRFYLFVSVLFFLGLSLLNHGHILDIDRRELDHLPIEAEKNTQAAEQRAAAARPPAPEGAAPAAKPASKLTVNRDSDLGRRISDKLMSGALKPSEITDAIEHRVPSLLFLGVPLFALLLKLAYWRQRRYYIEHLIFSLHLHTWGFLVAMVGSGYLRLAGFGPGWLAAGAGWALGLWAVWYLLASFRAVYAQGWGRTVLKAGLLALSHAFILALTATLLALGTLAWFAFE
ncbi:MAG: DUF3667 domain-containing protein [Verrucomicrobia bacterium]|nr:DUF3667 domain-containing protein [Verrucomicrobiota bacterium]